MSPAGGGVPATADPRRCLPALAAELRAEGSVISPHVRGEEELDAAAGALGELAGSGPHAEGRAGLMAGVVESIREGYLLHYGSSRLIDPPDADLALLAGDYLYAKGLGLLAAEGDLASVNLLAELISASAELHAEGDAGPRTDAVSALWLAAATAIATGPGSEDLRAAAEVRAGGDAQALFARAQQVASREGLDDHLARAVKTVGFHPSNRG